MDRTETIVSIAGKPSTGRFSGVVLAGRLLGTFSLTKSSPICKRNFSCRFSLQKAPNDTGVSSSAELDQQALPAGHLPPFEKGGRKLYFIKTCSHERQQPNHPPEGWAGIYKSAACLGGFSLTKAPSFAIRNSDCKIHPQRRLNDREFRALRSSTKGFAFGNHSLLKKAGENFILQKLGAAR